MQLLLSGIFGACVAICVALLARSQFYILAGLAPLFPTFALFAHFLSYREGGADQVRDVALFGVFSTIPYLMYVLSVYVLVQFLRIEWALLLALILWCVGAYILYAVWNRV